MNTDQVHDVISWNDATITGVLIAFVLTFGSVIYYLFKVNQELYRANAAERERLYNEFTSERDRLYKDHLSEIKTFNDLLMKINTQYYDAIRNFVDFNKK